MITPIQAKFDLSGLVNIINKANKRFANNERRSFYRTTNNWDNKPTFHVKGFPSGEGITDYKVFTTDKRWFWINYGTEPHEIKPRGNYPLRFREGYTPKTEPNRIKSIGSGKRHGGVVETWSVIQNIEPRNWTKKIKDGATKRWSRALEKELKDYVARSVK